MRNLLGGKGANLAEMTNLGLPVPPGFTITTEVCTYYYANGKSLSRRTSSAQVEAALAQVGAHRRQDVSATPTNPLLVSVRSGARASMPGMMDTVLNLGLNDETVEAVAKSSGDARFAYDSYRRFITDVFRRRARRRAPPVRGDPRRVQGPQGLHARHRPLRRRLGRCWSDATRRRSRRSSASRSRRIRTSSSGARSAPCSAPG